MTPGQILDGLTDAFRLLTGTARGVVPARRHSKRRSPGATISFTVAEQALLRRLSVFAGGCTLDAAEAVCSDDNLVARLDVLDLLDRW